MWKIAHPEPICRRSLQCRLGFHDWLQLEVSSGGRKRMVTGRRGCRKCGRIELRTSTGISLPYWWKWGYCDPADLGMSVDAFNDKYIVRDEEVQL